MGVPVPVDVTDIEALFEEPLGSVRGEERKEREGDDGVGEQPHQEDQDVSQHVAKFPIKETVSLLELLKHFRKHLGRTVLKHDDAEAGREDDEGSVGLAHRECLI